MELIHNVLFIKCSAWAVPSVLVMCRRSKKEGSLNLQGGDREKEQMKGGGQDRDILGTNEPGESDKGDVG